MQNEQWQERPNELSIIHSKVPMTESGLQFSLFLLRRLRRTASALRYGSFFKSEKIEQRFDDKYCMAGALIIADCRAMMFHFSYSLVF